MRFFERDMQAAFVFYMFYLEKQAEHLSVGNEANLAYGTELYLHYESEARQTQRILQKSNLRCNFSTIIILASRLHTRPASGNEMKIAWGTVSKPNLIHEKTQKAHKFSHLPTRIFFSPSRIIFSSSLHWCTCNKIIRAQNMQFSWCQQLLFSSVLL